MTSTEGELWPPLVAIRVREVQLRKRVLAAREEAEALVREAEEKALAIREGAEEEAPEEARSFYAGEIAKAQAEARKIVAAGEKEAEALRTQGRKNLEEAAQRIAEAVLG